MRLKGMNEEFARRTHLRYLDYCESEDLRPEAGDFDPPVFFFGPFLPPFP